MDWWDFMEQFSIVKRGYDPEEVDRYITTLEHVIKSYKEKDNAIKNAIISSQIAADGIIENAKKTAIEIKANITKQLSYITEAVDMQRVKIKAFQDVYSTLVRKYLQEIDIAEMSELMEKLNDLERTITDLRGEGRPPTPTVPVVNQDTYLDDMY